MNYSIEPSLKVPAYLQLYRLIVADIVSGVYTYGTRLPSKRTIAEETGVSVITVEHTLALLCDEGYAEARERSGCYVTYREADFQSTAAQPTEEYEAPVVPLVSEAGQNLQAFPYSVLARTIRKVLLDYGNEILVKSPNKGCEQLRMEICAWLARSRGISVGPEQIVVGSGAEYLYGLVAQLFYGRVFALERPSYEKIHQVYDAMGITCDFLPLSAEGIPTAQLDRTEATVLHVTPFNSFPSGITAGISKKKEYLRWADCHHGFIVEDNYDSELTVSAKAEDTLFSLSHQDNVIYINTFSRTISPSMRIGYMILPRQLMTIFDDRLGFYSCTVPLFDQLVIAELLRSGDFERHVNRVRRQRRRSKAEHS